MRIWQQSSCVDHGSGRGCWGEKGIIRWCLGMEVGLGQSRLLRKLQLLKRNGKDKSPLWERGFAESSRSEGYEMLTHAFCVDILREENDTKPASPPLVLCLPCWASERTAQSFGWEADEGNRPGQENICCCYSTSMCPSSLRHWHPLQSCSFRPCPVMVGVPSRARQSQAKTPKFG